MQFSMFQPKMLFVRLVGWLVARMSQEVTKRSVNGLSYILIYPMYK